MSQDGHACVGAATTTARIKRVQPEGIGEMAEWLKAHAWKACLGETLTWVRIPLSPPSWQIGSKPETADLLSIKLNGRRGDEPLGVRVRGRCKHLIDRTAFYDFTFIQNREAVTQR